ncbi:MAG: hypothetical protein LBM66_06465, partial [Bifidobacteriaceae bacterium]|nr:hypothetical protein [Bifidobacteriaceae bacterium]
MSSARSASTIPERGSAARRHRFGRLVAVVAGAAMALTGVGLNAQAASAATAGVQKVADELAGVADSPAQAQAAAQAMKDLGLIDSKGNVREVSAKVGGRELRGQALKDWAKDA